MAEAIEAWLGRGHTQRTTRPNSAARLLVLGAFLLVTAAVRADIAPNQVLVVYNSAAAEAVALKDAYLAAHPAIPAANLLDLNDAALVTSDLTYPQFTADVRDPVRSFLCCSSRPSGSRR